MPTAASPLVSIIVPVLNDTEQLAALVEALMRPASVEIIVALGSQPDAAMRRLQARTPRVTWVESAAGRAIQMNAGARRARGRWLLFLHADARLEPGWLERLAHVDAQRDAIGGSFRFALESDAWPARLIEWGVRWRVRLFDLPYGDQALFVRRSVFERLHGYRELPLMEDVDLVQRLRREGPLWHDPLPVHISPRRWEREGWCRRTVENVLLVMLFQVGVDPARLARIYYRDGRRRQAAAVLQRDVRESD